MWQKVLAEESDKQGIRTADDSEVKKDKRKAIARAYASSGEVNGWGRRQFVVCGIYKRHTGKDLIHSQSS